MSTATAARRRVASTARLDGKDSHEGQTAARSHHRRAHRGIRTARRRHHHPGHRQGKAQQGKVIAVGKGRIEKDGKITPLDVKAGDTILFGKYAGQEIKIDGNEYLIIREEEVLGVIEK